MFFSLSELKMGSPLREQMIFVEKWVHVEMTQFSNQIEVSHNQIIKNYSFLAKNVMAMHQSLLIQQKKNQHDFRTILSRVKLTIVIDNASKSSRSVRSLASRKATQRKQVAPEEASQPNGARCLKIIGFVQKSDNLQYDMQGRWVDRLSGQASDGPSIILID